MRNRVFKTISIFGFFQLLVLTPAVACSCIPSVGVGEAYLNSDLIFSGTATNEAISSQNEFSIELREFTFEVIETYKGEQQTETIIQTGMDSAMCGYNFQVGEQYLIYASNIFGTYQTGLCERTALLPTASSDVTELESLQNGQTQPEIDTLPEFDFPDGEEPTPPPFLDEEIIPSAPVEPEDIPPPTDISQNPDAIPNMGPLLALGAGLAGIFIAGLIVIIRFQKKPGAF